MASPRPLPAFGRPAAIFAAGLRALALGGGAMGLVTGWLVLLGLGSAPVPILAAESRPVGEYELKAAFLVKLPLFTHWPADRFAAPDSPLIIGVLGENPFGPSLESTIKGRMIEGHPLVLKQCRDADEAAGCHLVFIADGKARAAEKVLHQLAAAKVLTVGDAPGFAARGGMVNLVAADRKVRLEINPEVIGTAGLRLDPQFRQLATAVQSESAPSKAEK